MPADAPAEAAGGFPPRILPTDPPKPDSGFEVGAGAGAGA